MISPLQVLHSSRHPSACLRLGATTASSSSSSNGHSTLLASPTVRCGLVGPVEADSCRLSAGLRPAGRWFRGPAMASDGGDAVGDRIGVDGFVHAVGDSQVISLRFPILVTPMK